MALTDIARQLKQTFGGYDADGIDGDVDALKERFPTAEGIRIGQMNYIVIDDPFMSREMQDDDISPLFYNSINKRYAIIDPETSSTLIDEVYSRIIYIRRNCTNVSTGQRSARKSPEETLIANVKPLFADVPPEKKIDILSDRGSQGQVSIFQCHLVKDTGVAASSESYSFLLRDGTVKTIPDEVIRNLNTRGRVELLTDPRQIDEHKSDIQSAIFERYSDDAEVEIQSVSVKSIFEIVMSSLRAQLAYTDPFGRRSVYRTHYLLGDDSEFDVLNAQIHVCNLCAKDLVDVEDESRVYRLHTNIDAIDKEETQRQQKTVYATGCERCLERCPVCGAWHFAYGRHNREFYDRKEITLASGRGFIRSIEPGKTNYCSCRENIEWIHDQRERHTVEGETEEYGVIPLEEMAFFNFVDEQIASFRDYDEFRAEELKNLEKRLKSMDVSMRGVEEQRAHGEALLNFKKKLANEYKIDENEIYISSSKRSKTCDSCGGVFYEPSDRSLLQSYRCEVCSALKEGGHMVTRRDGMIFMMRKRGKNTYLNKYVMTGLGLLKKVSGKQMSGERKQITGNGGKGNGTES